MEINESGYLNRPEPDLHLSTIWSMQWSVVLGAMSVPGWWSWHLHVLWLAAQLWNCAPVRIYSRLAHSLGLVFSSFRNCFPYRVLFINMFRFLLRAPAWWLVLPDFLEPLMAAAAGAKKLDLRFRLWGLLSYAQTVSGNIFHYKSEKKWGTAMGNISGHLDCEYRYLADPVCFQYWNYLYSKE